MYELSANFIFAFMGRRIRHGPCQLVLSGFSITCDFQRTISINSFVDAFGELRKRDARSSFSRQYLGSILEPSTDLLTPSAKLSTSAEGISLCESSQVEYMSKAADSLGEVEQLVLTSVLLLGEHAYGVALHEKISELAAPRNVRPGTLRAPVGQRSGNRPGGCSRGSRAMANRNASSVR